VTSSGLPIGLQIVGARLHSEPLLRIAASVERMLRG
jgi:Asp-tRNA(Asn)/Glu-tRNA(Gln) amidotransferase A subunit family amidase